MTRRGVEATVIGTFTDSGRCIVRVNGKVVMNLDMTFLHEGNPRKSLKSSYTRKEHQEPDFSMPKNLTETLYEMLERPNGSSFEFISCQFDHTVQGGAVIGPLQGKGKVNGNTSVTKPFPESEKGIVCSQALHPNYADIDTYHMAACSIDEAVRNVIAAGGHINHLALMDNFCWSSSNDPQRLGQLKASAQACYDYATKYGTPFISGKDSMFNDFSGFDKDGKPIKISVPPTLLISSTGVIDDVTKSISIDPKFAGDLVYMIGETKDETGGSEYLLSKGFVGNKIPKVDIESALKIYKKFEEAADLRFISSSISLGLGGLALALSKATIAGQLGMEIDLSLVSKSADLSREDFLLFSETQTRFLVTIDPKKQKEFEKHFAGITFAQIGKITEDQNLLIKGFAHQKVIKSSITDLNKHYRKTFKDY